MGKSERLINIIQTSLEDFLHQRGLTKETFTFERIHQNYLKKRVSLENTLQLLEMYVEHETYENLGDIIDALDLFCKISPKNDYLFKYLEYMVVSHNWFKLKTTRHKIC